MLNYVILIPDFVDSSGISCLPFKWFAFFPSNLQVEAALLKGYPGVYTLVLFLRISVNEQHARVIPDCPNRHELHLMSMHPRLIWNNLFIVFSHDQSLSCSFYKFWWSYLLPANIQNQNQWTACKRMRS